ncbi:MAG: hypothetical protein H0V67_11945 [Geodermatophilaceae bacterium]|nr:hypothetical protein [Geodermatophilaceae bacterium]
MQNRWFVAVVGADNAALLATESRTAMLAREYRPKDLGDGRIALSELALGASRELGEEEDGAITEDGEGLRIWVGDDGYELDVTDISA